MPQPPSHTVTHTTALAHAHAHTTHRINNTMHHSHCTPDECNNHQHARGMSPRSASEAVAGATHTSATSDQHAH